MAGGGHVTTVCSPRQRGCDHRMRYFRKDAYGVRCLELWFSEMELFEELKKLTAVFSA